MMNAISITYLIFTVPVMAFFLMFAFYSIKENKLRAAALSILISLFFTALFTIIFILDQNDIFKIFAILSIITLLILFFAPIGKSSELKINHSDERFDERDTMFARNDYKAGTDKYIEYYENNPDKQKIDDKIRTMPDLLEAGGKYYDPIRAAYVKGIFELESFLANHVDGNINPVKTVISTNDAVKLIKEKANHLGAAGVGIAELDQRWVYSNVGRGPGKWGDEINLKHKYAICFTVEMDHCKVAKAPQYDVIEESANQYINAQKISIILANFIRELGYSARAHVSGSNYQVIMSAVAYFAGLGELGRHGYLISKKFGARVRLGAVTTDLPLISDKPIKLGVQDFCNICKKCAHNCPSNAITEGEKQNIRGVEKWQLNIEQCYRYWRVSGTDCALCMKVCPFSHPDNFVHNVIRYGIKRSALARKLSLHADNLFYGSRH
jgi:reductive dehalogenase